MNNGSDLIYGSIALQSGRSKQYRLVLEGQQLQVLVRYVEMNGNVVDVISKVLSASSGFNAVRDGENIVVTIYGWRGLLPPRTYRF